MANEMKPCSKKSLNGEPNPHLKQSHASGSEESLGDSLIEYNQPESSAEKIHDSNMLHPKISTVQQFPSWIPRYTLSEVDEEVGHPVVHFLCTGNYETLRTASQPGASKAAIKYRRSMLDYQAARDYDLYDLETYAKKYIEMFGKSMSIFDSDVCPGGLGHSSVKR
ncbi:hypothetical protein IFM5058_09663 [Aspergillus udagawae]|nr:hypothetical protein IFM5058_09663 [Aspergillus udagawae]